LVVDESPGELKTFNLRRELSTKPKRGPRLSRQAGSTVVAHAVTRIDAWHRSPVSQAADRWICISMTENSAKAEAGRNRFPSATYTLRMAQPRRIRDPARCRVPRPRRQHRVRWRAPTRFPFAWRTAVSAVEGREVKEVPPNSRQQDANSPYLPASTAPEARIAPTRKQRAPGQPTPVVHSAVPSGESFRGGNPRLL